MTRHTTSYATGWRDATQHATPIDDYADLHQAAAQAISDKLAARQDPAAAATALLDIVDAPDPPLRVFLGSDALRIAEDDYQRRLTTWRQWQPFPIRSGQ